VQQLIAKHEELKAEEAAFKAKCKSDRQGYLDSIRVLDAELLDDDPESSKLRDLEEQHEKISSKHGKMPTWRRPLLTYICRYWRITSPDACSTAQVLHVFLKLLSLPGNTPHATGHQAC